MPYQKILNHELLSLSEERHLIDKTHQGCMQSRERLILLNMRLVHSVCSKYATETVSAEDLVGDGVQGLIRAIEGFDLSIGTRLSTYATLEIHHSVGRSPLLQATIRLPANVAQAVRKIRKAMTCLAWQGNLDPKNEEVAAMIDDLEPKSVGELRLLMETTLAVVSLDTPIGGEDGKELSITDVIKYEDPAYDRLLNEVNLEFFLSKLQRHEAIVLSLSYGIPREMTNIQIAEAARCHRNKVPEIRDRALRKCQRIAEHIKSRQRLSPDVNWPEIIAEPGEQTEMIF